MRSRTIAFAGISLTLIAALEFYSCKKMDKQQPPPGNDTTINTGTNLTASFTGMVYDQSNNPVSGATVRAGAVTTTTDISGSFSISNALVKPKAVIVIEKTGFFRSARTVSVSTNESYAIRFQLIKKTSVYTFNGSTGGTVNFGTSSLVFPANSVTDINGNPYTGTVSAACYSFNPAAAGFTDLMPGELTGINTAGQERGLRSYAMMAVELAGSAGQELKIAAGKSVSLNFGITSSLQASAPATIPLWYFNDSTGLWKQEGTASRSGTKYTASVQHFSYWNCDDEFPLIPFNITLKMADGSPVAHKKVEFRGTGPDSAMYGFGYTNSNGHASGMIPAGKVLTMKVSSPPCNPVVYSTTVGPYSGPVNMGTIITTAVPPSAILSIAGTVKDCYNLPMSKGSVLIAAAGIGKTIPLVNGNFNSSWLTCQPGNIMATITIRDSNGISGKTDTIVLASGTTYNYNGTYCGLIANVIVGGTGTSWVSSNYLDTIRSGYNNATAKTEVYAKWTSLVGSYSDLKLVISAAPGSTGSFVLNSFGTHMMPGSSQYFTGTNLTTTITEYGPVGGFIRGTYSGTVIDSATNATYPANGMFFVRRNY